MTTTLIPPEQSAAALAAIMQLGLAASGFMPDTEAAMATAANHLAETGEFRDVEEFMPPDDRRRGEDLGRLIGIAPKFCDLLEAMVETAETDSARRALVEAHARLVALMQEAVGDQRPAEEPRHDGVH